MHSLFSLVARVCMLVCNNIAVWHNSNSTHWSSYFKVSSATLVEALSLQHILYIEIALPLPYFSINFPTHESDEFLDLRYTFRLDQWILLNGGEKSSLLFMIIEIFVNPMLESQLLILRKHASYLHNSSILDSAKLC